MQYLDVAHSFQSMCLCQKKITIKKKTGLGVNFTKTHVPPIPKKKWKKKWKKKIFCSRRIHCTLDMEKKNPKKEQRTPTWSRWTAGGSTWGPQWNTVGCFGRITLIRGTFFRSNSVPFVGGSGGRWCGCNPLILHRVIIFKPVWRKQEERRRKKKSEM